MILDNNSFNDHTTPFAELKPLHHRTRRLENYVMMR